MRRPQPANGVSIPLATFQTECLRLIDEVARTGQSVVITRDGKPVARLVPTEGEPESLFGYMHDTVIIKGDVIAPIGDPWSADSGAHKP